MQQQKDLVDQKELVQPLGNLVITFAQAESALLRLVQACIAAEGAIPDDRCEPEATAIYKNEKAKDLIIAKIAAAGLPKYHRDEAKKHIRRFFTDKAKRNRYFHDDWYVNVFKPGGVAATRGLPPKKGSKVTYDEPKPEDVWALALRFRDHRGAFDASTGIISDRLAARDDL